MNENNLFDTPEQKEEDFNLYRVIFKYLIYWPWFVAGVLVCVAAAFIYLRYQTPVYNVSASVLIKEDDARSRAMQATNGALGTLQEMGGFSMTSSFDNEVEILKSRTLVQKVVTRLGLYISTVEDRSFGYDLPLYKNAPVQVYLTPEEAEKFGGAKLKMVYTPEGKLSVKAIYNLNGTEQNEEKTFDALPAVLPTPVGVFSFTKNDSVPAPAKEVKLITYISSPTTVAKGYAGALSVSPTSKTTTIAKISMQNSCKQRAVDFINTLVAFYNQDANDEKNEVAQKTADFIEDRIAIINRELGTTESQLADFKQKSGLTDLTTDAQLALQENSKYEQLRIENQTQIRLVEFLCDYIHNPANADEVIPANVGLQDQNLSSVIDQYNTLIIERKRLLRTSSENNPAVINMKTGIEAMRHSVQTTVASVLEGLHITKGNLDRQASKFEGRISKAPQQEKEFLTIARQQEIKAQLYIMLLQKREENAITLAATATNGRIIEQALPNNTPVAPKNKVILLVAFILGLGIPVGIIYLIDLLKYRIENREDVQKLTSVPLVAELPHCQKPAQGSIVVRENHNDIMEETFRGLRTNLMFMMESGEKVIMVSSTQPGEGKSFVAGNLAVSLALLGKKTLIVGMDIRKPGLNKVFNLSHREKGLTHYLSDPEQTDLFALVQPSDIHSNLDILPGGIVPPNPTELVARPVLDQGIARLKERYDYIILDTAPIGIVTDSLIISRVADLCLYVCRAEMTPKAAFQYINELKDNRKFGKLATVLNDIDLSKRKHSYGYGYGKKYGYGYGYGYGFQNNKKG